MSLPTGAVTFLFTDIEGSTLLMQKLGDRYIQAQTDHHAILRSAFRSNRGRELRTEGDSFFCVFQSALDACSAAAQAQKGFSEHEWPDQAPIRVRIGVHTGEAPLVGNEYIGVEVHHAARVAASAHGGQVVLSEATCALVRSALPSDVTLRDLGLHRLKDLARSERLYQLVVAGLQDTFPALRTMEATRNNLPTQLTSFVGREEDVAHARRLLESTHLLTLVGPGGIGKTRLSLQIAADAIGAFKNGVYFVPLSAVRDPDLIASVIAQVLSLAVPGNRMPLEVAIEHVRDKELLLVLDNFEQLLPDGAPVVSKILQSSPGVKAVASSRAPLKVYGEQELAVPPLRLPDLRALPSLEALSQYAAVKLFIERALAAKPEFQVTNANAPAIAGICERVDGLPLAIELAAARVKLFNPHALLGRLETSLSVLGGGARDLPDRQQTLGGAIAWSYDLLSEPLQRLFSRFSVFARGANLEQAEAVCGPADEVGLDLLSGLDELADQSLLRRMPDLEAPRLQMLQVIRDFSGECLEHSGEADAIRDRHAAAYQALAEEAAPHLFGAEQRTWLDRLELDHDNFRAAFDSAVSRGDAKRGLCLGAAFWRFWQMRGHLREGRARLEAVLSMAASHEHPKERALALEAAGGIAYWQGDMKYAQAMYDESLALTRRFGDDRAIANAMYNDAFPQMVNRDDVPKGRALLEAALPIFRRLGDDRGVAGCLWALGQCYASLEEYEAAISVLADAVGLFERLGDRFGLGWALFVHGLLGIKLNDLDAAETDSVRALRIFADANDVSGVVLVLDALAEAAYRQGDVIRAARIGGAKSAHEASSGTGLTSVVALREGWRSDKGLSDAETAAWAEGQAMSLDLAIEYALSSDAALEAGA